MITEVKPTAAMKGVLNGHEVLTMEEASKVGDIFCTATGVKDIIRKEHFENMRDGAIVCNTGHYDSEINIPELEEISVSNRTIRENCEEYTLKNGNKIFLLAQGRLINLAAAEGHPSEVMDMSFANQFLSHVSLAQSHTKGEKLPNSVIEIPVEQDEFVAKTKLETMNMAIDSLTEEQIKYIDDYNSGT